MVVNSISGPRIPNPGHISERLATIFWVKNSVSDPDPEF